MDKIAGIIQNVINSYYLAYCKTSLADQYSFNPLSLYLKCAKEQSILVMLFRATFRTSSPFLDH